MAFFGSLLLICNQFLMVYFDVSSFSMNFFSFFMNFLLILWNFVSERNEKLIGIYVFCQICLVFHWFFQFICKYFFQNISSSIFSCCKTFPQSIHSFFSVKIIYIQMQKRNFEISLISWAGPYDSWKNLVDYLRRLLEFLFFIFFRNCFYVSCALCVKHLERVES